jgi:hypothetical protein
MANAQAGRERIVCGNCDLPYYADEGRCPYCDGSGDTATGTDAERKTEESTSSGLFQRLKRAFGM